MQCSEIREMLSLYLDDVLDQKDRAKVEGHLKTCGTCRQELEDLQETVRLIRSLGEVAPPENFRKELMSKLREAPVPVGKSLKSRIAPIGSWLSGGWRSGTWRYAAAAVIIVGIGIGAGIYQLNQTNLLIGQSSELARNNELYNTDNSSNKMAAPARDEFGDSSLTYRINKDIPEEASNSDKIAATKRGVGKASEANQAGDTGVSDESAAAALPEAAPEGITVQGIVENKVKEKSVQKIVKEANLGLEVENYQNFSSKLLAVTEQYDGYIENSSENLNSEASASFIIRVPNEQFPKLIADLEKLGKVTTKQVSGKDVTGEFVDAESRLRNYRAQELRLLGLIEKAENLSEVVTLENELSRVRGEIETLQGRLNVLEDTVVYSTIRLDVIQASKPEVTPPEGTVGKAISNFKESCIALINFIGNIVTFTGWILPWVLFIGATGGSVVYYRRTKQKRDDK